MLCTLLLFPFGQIRIAHSVFQINAPGAQDIEAVIAALASNSFYPQGGLSHGVELPQQVVLFPHRGIAVAVSFGIFGAEIKRSSRFDPHSGHSGDSFSRLVRTNTSAIRPQAPHWNSYMGI